MELKAIIHEIEQLPLSKRFFVMEETLRSIKNEEFKHQTNITVDNVYIEASNNKELDDFSYLVSEKSLANDWLSEEDNRWDSLL